MAETVAAKRCSQSWEWSAVSMETNTVSPRPSFTGSSTATRRSMTPSASSFWIRFQHGVCDRPTRSPIAAMESVASVCSRARIFRSIASKAVSVGFRRARGAGAYRRLPVSVRRIFYLGTRLPAPIAVRNRTPNRRPDTVKRAGAP